MSFCIDFLTYTIKQDLKNYDEVAELILKILPLNVLEDMDTEKVHFIQSNRFKYSRSLVYDNGVQAYFDGQEGMGVLIVLSGSVLNNTVIPNDIQNMREFYERLKNYNYNISRLDVACDTDIEFSYFYNKVRAGEYICASYKVNYLINDDNVGTIYLGGRGNPYFYRIYDKNKCSKDTQKGFIAEGDWSRVEIECRNHVCKRVLEYYVNEKIGEVFKKKILFVKEKVKNMSRDADQDMRYVNALNNPKYKANMKFEKLESDTDKWFREIIIPIVKAYSEVYDMGYIHYLIANAVASENIKNKLLKSEILLRKSNVYNFKKGGVKHG